MKLVSYGDTIDAVVTKLAQGDANALSVLEQIRDQCQAIDPKCDSPFAPLLQLDDYKITGHFLWALYEKVCDCDLVRLLALLRYASMGRIRQTDLRANITHRLGHVPPPWFRLIDPVNVLSLVRAHYPQFGAPACPR